jgi:hypothetical protein
VNEFTLTGSKQNEIRASHPYKISPNPSEIEHADGCHPSTLLTTVVPIMQANNLIQHVSVHSHVLFQYLRWNLALLLAAAFCNKYKNNVTNK